MTPIKNSIVTNQLNSSYDLLNVISEENPHIENISQRGCTLIISDKMEPGLMVSCFLLEVEIKALQMLSFRH
jgi:hypothetical protein